MNEASAELEAAYAWAVELGLPMTIEEVARPPIPDADNVVAALRPLLEIWTDEEGPDDALLDQVEAALGRPQAQFYCMGASWAYPKDSWQFASFLRGAARAFASRALDRAAAKDAVGAGGDIRLIRRLAWVSGQEPSLIGALVAMIVEGIAMARIPEIAECFRDNANGLVQLREAVQASWPELSIHRAMRYEVFYAIDAARNLELVGGLDQYLSQQMSGAEDQAPEKSEPPGWLHSGLPTDIESRASMARILQVWCQAWSARGASNQEFAHALRQVGKPLDALAETDRSYLFAAFSFPGAGTAHQLLAAEDRHALAIARLRVMEHRALTGKLPQNLREAGAVDKVQGREIRYAVKKRAFCIWTNGPDGIDRGPHFARSMPSFHGGAWLTFPPTP